jgi:hypothetical protein
MSKATRLSKLEAAFPNPDQAGRRCRDCGGVTIDDALTASQVLTRGRTWGMTPERAERVMQALEAGTPTCEACGAETLHGCLAAMRERRRSRTIQDE